MKEKSALVLGLGSSGEAAALLLRRLRWNVVVVDSARSRNLVKKAAMLRRAGIRVILGENSLPGMDFSIAIISPGIRSDSKWVKKLKKRKIETISEFELGALSCKCAILAVTGSNGKSTLVAFCRDVLEAAGLRVKSGGNCGPPISEVSADSDTLDWIVAEVSSFQLEMVKNFSPRIGVLINLNPNHLDRHGTMKVYAACKKKLFASMGKEDTAIVPQDLILEWKHLAPQAKWLCFGSGPDAHYRYVPGRIEFNDGFVSIKDTLFDNPVMGMTAAAATAALTQVGISARLIGRCARSFVNLPHRYSIVREIGGVRFIDDSKATNLAATVGAVLRTGRNVRLIAGGLIKEDNLDKMGKLFESKVVCAYLIGNSAERLARAWKSLFPCRICGTLQRAVLMAWKESSPDDAILLAPGAASFDQFESYEERGKAFVKIVNSLGGGE